jgi:hypothetical protein
MRTLLASIMIAFTTLANAGDIVVINPWSTAGSAHLTAKYLAEGLTERGMKAESTSSNNCALAKSVWQSSEKALILRDNISHATPLANCNIETTADNLVLVVNRSPLYFCNNGPSGKTLEDFLKPGSSHSVGDSANAPTVKIFKQIDRESNIKTRAIVFDVNTKTAAAAKSGEIDFILASGNWPEQQLGAKCFWTTGDMAVDGYKRGKDLWPNNKMLDTTYIYWFLAKGFTPEELTQLRKTAMQAWKESGDWIELRKKRGWEDHMVPTDPKIALRYIDTEFKIWTDK